MVRTNAPNGLRPLRRALLLVGVAVAGPAGLTACGSAHARHPTATPVNTTRTPAKPRGDVLVVFKRAVGADPEASYFTLYSSGAGLATVVYGGRDGARVHSFAVGANRMHRLVGLLRHTRLRDATLGDPNLYTYWVITRGGSFRLRQGTVPREAQPLLGVLNGIADDNNLY